MTRTLDVGRTSGKGKSSHDTRCIPPSKPACGVAPAGAASHKIPSTLPLKLFLGDAAPLLADRISAGLGWAGRNEDCDARVPLLWRPAGETTTTVCSAPDGYIWPSRYRRNSHSADHRTLVEFLPLRVSMVESCEICVAQCRCVSRARVSEVGTIAHVLAIPYQSSTPLCNHSGGFNGRRKLPISAQSNPIRGRKIKIHTHTPAQSNALKLDIVLNFVQGCLL